MTCTEICDRVVAMTELTNKTGQRFTRSINDLLQSLPGHVLMEVAMELKRRGWKPAPKLNTGARP